MAGKKTTAKRRSAQAKSGRRRTAASGGPPARSRRKSGNLGFSGYEYQIEVSVWVALDLILAKGAADEIEIEPRSEEDIQAAIKDPAAASLGLVAQGAQFRLNLQAKGSCIHAALRATGRPRTARGVRLRLRQSAFVRLL